MCYGLRIITFAASVLAVAACASTSSPSTTGPGGTSGTAASIVKVSGDSQSAQYEQTVPKPLIVKVTDASGNPVSGAPVAWAIQLSGASQALQATTTNASGETQISPMLGGSPGLYSIVAGVTSHSVTFTGSANVGLASGNTHLASGLFTNCGLTTQGAAWCWGSNAEGQLGNGDTGMVAGPVPVSGGGSFAQIVTGGYLTCGLTAGGALYCWGQAIYPQMGNGASGSSGTFTAPTAAGNGMTFSAVAIGEDQSCGISAGVSYCWGFGHQGQLGTGDTVTRTAPTAVHVPTGVTFTSLTAGTGFACGLTSAGAAYCWGGNDVGELGIGSSSTAYSDVPILVSGGHAFASLGAGSASVCGLTTGGAVYCWGQGTNGNGTSAAEYAPTAVTQSGTTFTQLSVGGNACALTSTGAAYCWGANQEGQLGSGSFSTSGSVPVAVTGGHAFSTILAGPLSVCGYTTTQTMYCWGDNSVGQLGLGASADTVYAVPQPVPGLGTP